MATVHFVKDGKRSNGERVTKSAVVSAANAADKIGRFDFRYSEIPPTINAEVQTSDWAEYKHVVLEIAQGESAPPFSKPGYYYIVGVTPAECKRLLDISDPSM
ncbi:hypothetical protein [Lysobacter capsici]|uniref:hypothetical protein n=1 Tax=Lysobacter capsici TaxID=435897 RepID=UPI00287B7D88|nr:hypothetical protein [Lysobacter capsici]WND80369.1 hypothetical protein RJ610_24360 [Lysobacter capsici]WND85566.1 hypothetical protein RJ609_24380 [Lysobacter capsici]